jgi:hypothetical protein
MKLPRIVIPLLMLLIDGCIDPLDVTVISQAPKVVVDGLVTNDPGPYTVKLFYSKDANVFSKDAVPVRKASVSIIEDGSIARPLAEVSDGIYQTDNTWQAQIGKSYEVRIVTSDLKTYGSQPQTLEAAGSVDSIYTTFESNGIVGLDDGSLLLDAISVSIDARAASPDAARLRWRFSGVYHAHTYPELRTRITRAGDVLPFPVPCSGYIGYGDALIKVGECTCCECWPTEYNTGVLLSNPQVARDAVFKNIHVTKIPVTGVRFKNRYHIEIEQFSLSPELYSFWKLVKTQQESAGSLFQPSTVKVRGNVFSGDGKEEALGIFAVCGVARKTVFVDPAIIPYDVPQEVHTEGCQFIFSNAVTEKPSYWP